MRISVLRTIQIYIYIFLMSKIYDIYCVCFKLFLRYISIYDYLMSLSIDIMLPIVKTIVDRTGMIEPVTKIF